MAHVAVPVFNAFRFYADDGGEAASTPLAAQDTNITVDVSAGDVIIHLRCRIDEINGVDGNTTDDYSVQFSKNAGAYTDPISTGNDVQPALISGLVDGNNTTNRATDGISDPALTFQAGKQEESNRFILDYQLLADRFTEHVWALKLISADLANNDTIDFRITYNSGTPGMTNNVTPRITISKVTTTPISDTFDMRWNLSGVIQDILDLRWNMQGNVSDTLDLRWNILNDISDLLDIRWNLLQNAEDTFDTRWNILANIQDILDIRWNIGGGSVSDILDVRWNIINNVQDTFDTRWNILNAIQDVMEFRWNLLQEALDTFDTRWNIIANTQDTLDMRWNIVGAVQDVLEIQWNILNNIQDNIDLRWDIKQDIQDLIDVRWNIVNAVSDVLDLRWNLTGGVQDVLNLQWNMSGTVQDILELQWQIEQTRLLVQQIIPLIPNLPPEAQRILTHNFKIIIELLQAGEFHQFTTADGKIVTVSEGVISDVN